MQPPEKGLKRGLSARHIRFMALGSAIGTGLFYGSASAIQMAGPAVLLAYLIGGAAVFMVMRALGEMAVHNPVSGSFGHYASTYLGPMARADLRDELDGQVRDTLEQGATLLLGWRR